MTTETRAALVDRLRAFDPLVEVGIGHRTDVAAALADAGHAVTATDVHERPVPEGVRFVRDSLTDPDESVYADAEAVYALNCPPELHRPLTELGRAVDAAALFTTLGADQPTVPVERETLPAETLYRVRAVGPSGRS